MVSLAGVLNSPSLSLFRSVRPTLCFRMACGEFPKDSSSSSPHSSPWFPHSNSNELDHLVLFFHVAITNGICIQSIIRILLWLQVSCGFYLYWTFVFPPLFFLTLPHFTHLFHPLFYPYLHLYIYPSMYLLFTTWTNSQLLTCQPRC